MSFGNLKLLAKIVFKAADECLWMDARKPFKNQTGKAGCVGRGNSASERFSLPEITINKSLIVYYFY